VSTSATTWTNTRDKALRERAERVIPGGMYGHMSTRMLPSEFPQFFAGGRGARITDADGNVYIDYMCAYGPSLLGYLDPAVEGAARAQAERGDVLNGPAPVMVEFAEALVGLVRHADWAMFCKNGTDATTMAMTVARARTRRRKVLVAEHAYHGAAPWCTPNPIGTTAEDRAHLVPYRYNDADSLAAAAREAGDDLAAVFATPFRHDAFADQELLDADYARACRRLCDERQAALVVDDVRAGLRLARDCSWSLVGVEPDLSCWGKAIANGYPISALCGSEPWRAAASRIYVTGSFWFAAVAMAAGVATLAQVRDSDYLERTVRTGTLLRQGLARQAAAAGFELRQSGPVQMPQILFGEDPDFRVGFAWAAACVRRGVYVHPWHNMFVSAALTEADVSGTLAVTEDAFAEVRDRRAHLQPPAQLAPILGR
jgi:glutamate-1-semialdehyde 2,1-aminomutase